MHTSMKKIPLSIDKAIKINDGKDKMDMNFKRSQQQVYIPVNMAGAYSIRSHSLHTTLVESQPHCLSQRELGWDQLPQGLFDHGFTNNTDVSWIISQGLEKLGIHMYLQNQIPNRIHHLFVFTLKQDLAT